MNNRIQTTPERGLLRPQRGRFTATSIPGLLVLGGVLICLQMRVAAFEITGTTNQTVLTNTPISFQVAVTPTIPTNQLSFSLSSDRPATDATNALLTPNADGAVFTWQPTQEEVVTFTVIVGYSATQLLPPVADAAISNCQPRRMILAGLSAVLGLPSRPLPSNGIFMVVGAVVS